MEILVTEVGRIVDGIIGLNIVEVLYEQGYDATDIYYRPRLIISPD